MEVTPEQDCGLDDGPHATVSEDVNAALGAVWMDYQTVMKRYQETIVESEKERAEIDNFLDGVQWTRVWVDELDQVRQEPVVLTTTQAEGDKCLK